MNDFLNFFKRLELITNAKNDSDIARAFGISRSAISHFKKSEKFPAETLVEYCLTNDVSIDWLLTGYGSAKKSLISNSPDPAVEKINTWLRAHPDDAEMILKIIEGREAMEKLKGH